MRLILILRCYYFKICIPKERLVNYFGYNSFATERWCHNKQILQTVNR
jgi:hypothetical protein